MHRFASVLFAVTCVARAAMAQVGDPQYLGGDYYGPASIGSSEPLFPYDDQEPWKHGYLQVMPFYGGHHVFLPYNYKAVFAQSQVAAGWGMPNVMPYSQQFWHRYEQQTDLSQPRLQLHPAPLLSPGAVPSADSVQPWYLPTTQFAPAGGAVPTTSALPVSGELISPAPRPRGGQSLKGPELP